MRILILLLLLVSLFQERSRGQGTIVYGNRIPASGIDAPIFDVDCQTRLTRPSYLAQAYVGLTPESLTATGPIRQFGFGENAGYIGSYDFTLQGVGNQLVYTQLRAWDATVGSTYETAVAAGGRHGFSNIVPMEAVIGPGAPRDPLGLQSFCLVPEPSSWALIGLGAMGLYVAGYRRCPSR